MRSHVESDRLGQRYVTQLAALGGIQEKTAVHDLHLATNMNDAPQEVNVVRCQTEHLSLTQPEPRGKRDQDAVELRQAAPNGSRLRGGPGLHLAVWGIGARIEARRKVNRALSGFEARTGRRSSAHRRPVQARPAVGEYAAIQPTLKVSPLWRVSGSSRSPMRPTRGLDALLCQPTTALLVTAASFSARSKPPAQ
jgi:hypothetical protein